MNKENSAVVSEIYVHPRFNAMATLRPSLANDAKQKKTSPIHSTNGWQDV